MGRVPRKQPYRYLTIKFITDTGATTRNYVLSFRAARLAKVGLAAAALLLVVGSVALVDGYFAHRRIAALEIRTEELRRQNREIGTLREDLSEIWVINERLQRMLAAGAAPRDRRPILHDLPWGVPLAQWVGTPFAMAPTGRPEEGVFLYANPGALVLATGEGTVADIRWDPAVGDVLIIDHGGGVQSRYASDLTFFVEPGELVAQGRTIGVIRPIDGTRRPMLFYQVLAEGQPVNPLLSMATDIPHG